MLQQINRKVGFRLVAKFGETGVVNLGKAVPIVGCAVGAGFDAAATAIIARKAIRAFVGGDKQEGKIEAT